MFNADFMITLFKAGALRALEYGAGLWGVGCVRNDVWQEVERFWLTVARYILNAPLRTPISAIRGDLNWLPFQVRAGSQAGAFWVRATKMDHTSLVHKAMCVQRQLVNKSS